MVSAFTLFSFIRELSCIYELFLYESGLVLYQDELFSNVNAKLCRLKRSHSDLQPFDHLLANCAR